MNEQFHRKIERKIDTMRKEGTYKSLKHITSPMSSKVNIEESERESTIILSSNNYLGLSDHPKVKDEGKRAIENFGAGTASVRFICGTFSIHRELEAALADFFHQPKALSYVSCWTANTGTIPLLAGKGDAILSDELNHASIIDGVRMSKAQKWVYSHSDMGDLSAKVREARQAVGEEGSILIITDGVFSMEGDLARLPEIVEIARANGAVLMVDDSHGTGVLGKSGRGTAEHFGVEEEIDILSSTLGKALGGGAGGFIASSEALIDYLSQSSRPQIFSNALPATIAGSAKAALEVLKDSPEVLRKLRENTHRIREGLKGMGFNPLEGDSAIIPIILGETSFAISMSQALLEEGVFVTGFGFPVVPEGSARIRIQSSAALSAEEIDEALGAFRRVGERLELI